MKGKIYYVFVSLVFMISYEKEGNNLLPPPQKKLNNVLLLKLSYDDYSLNGGHEFTFVEQADSFTVNFEYDIPDDFGYFRMFYHEIDRLIFYHSHILVSSSSRMLYPETLNEASMFERTTEVVNAPKFRIILDPTSQEEPDQNDVDSIWNEIKSVEMVQSYLKTNPDQKPYIYLNTTYHTEGWCWIVLMKN